MDSSNQEWQVDKILQRGRFKNVVHYLVLWKGFTPEEATWEPITNLQHCQQAIIDFQRQVNQFTKPEGSKKESKRRMNFRKVFKDQPTSELSNAKKEIDSNLNKQIECPSIQPLKNQDHLGARATAVQLIKQSNKVILQNDERLLSSNKSQECGKLLQEKTTQTRKRLRIQDEREDKISLIVSKKIKQNQAEPSIIPSQQTKINIKIFQLPQKEKSIPNLEQQSQDKKKELVSKMVGQKIIVIEKNQEKATPNIKQTLIQPQIKQTLSLPNNPNEKKANFYSTPSYKQSRYYFCDHLYKKQQNETLNNMIKKINGQPRIKSKISIVDISKNPQYLQQLKSIQSTSSNVSLVSVDLFIRIEYGWVLVGKNSENQLIMTDVNFIKQDSWRALQKKLQETKRN